MRWHDGGRCGLVGWMLELADRLRGVLPPNVGLGLGSPAALWPGEELPNAVPSRLAEFAAGRAAARAAMVAAGLAPAAVPVGSDRAPIWPSGVVGSISHCTGAQMAISAKSTYFQGLGLDLEPEIPIPAELWSSVLRPEELRPLQPSSKQDGLQALRIFAAKEAAYKAQYPTSRQLFDFQTLSVRTIDDHFTARFERDIVGFPKGFNIAGRFVAGDGLVLAFCTIPM